jgi:hypothetical protein
MPQFSDDLFLGTAVTGMGSNIGDPSPMNQGVGPMGRIYVWDVVAAAQSATNIANTQTPAGAGNLTLTAGTGTTSVVRADGTTVVQLDCPRNVRVTQAAAGTQQTFTITGYDIYGQSMSEAITSTVNSVVLGKKAFYQIASIAVGGGTTTGCSVGTGNKLGCPVRVTDAAYIAHIGYADSITDNAGVFVDADSTSPATTTTGDVRGTYAPSVDPDGTKRLVISICLPALAAGPNATRLGALGVNQNLAS